MKIGWRFRASVGVAVFAACCCSLHATTIEKMSLAQLAQVAPVIVRARCVSITTEWDAGDIWTLTTFNVLETWKGTSGAAVSDMITVRLLGGRVGDLTSQISGVPRFRPGEEVVLFLQSTSRGDLSVVSWEQGTFRIHRDPLSGTETVTQGTAAFAAFNPRTRRFETSGIRNLSLRSFCQEVRAAIAKRGDE